MDIFKVNTDEQKELSSVFGIQSIPSLLFIPKEGQPQMAMGALPKQRGLTPAEYVTSWLAVDWLDYWPLRWLYLDGFPRVVGSLLRRPSFTVIASSVRGPQRPLYSDGARVVARAWLDPAYKGRLLADANAAAAVLRLLQQSH